ncbi:uncharacterized protein LOC127847499 isoform X1 [Dreissena polymorpha]|uniref:Flavin reductase like domain-containing protein n=2 Tax=Dreissena polymorpha TaxID=45954 RepID=A0A9D4DEY9_DREPO|nr:uncharacterized protein LOC127847499 isoform X1 [Dreissena polymorpha]KAH3747523.1 hypothetical protein DPMN_181950 [Dreissena polymorpha]
MKCTINLLSSCNGRNFILSSVTHQTSARIKCNGIRRFASKDAEDILTRTDRLHHHDDDCNTRKTYKSIMQMVPQPVVVVTSGYREGGTWHKKGMTCTSFTSVSFSPPIISICLKIPSKFQTLLERTRHFAVHTLARHQVSYGMTFAQSIPKVCQFNKIPHYEDKEGLPVILGCSGVMQCEAESFHQVGDHNVWYGKVYEAHIDDNVSLPMLYQSRTFRSVGDEIFIQSFEDATLPFENWTHEAHLRMAWNYIRDYGRDKAIPMIRDGIQHYNQVHKDKIKTGYHETITMFYCFVIDDAITNASKPGDTFERFLKRNGHLLDRSLMYKYYSRERFSDPHAKEKFILPDLQVLPGM